MASCALHFAWPSLNSTLTCKLEPRSQQIVGFHSCSSCHVAVVAYKRTAPSYASRERRQQALGFHTSRSCHVAKAVSVAFESEESRHQVSEEGKHQVSDGGRFQTSTKTKDSLVRRIQHETQTRRDGDRDSTPAVRALTWALRGTHTEHAIAAILCDLTFPLSIFTSVIQKLGMEKKPRAAVALVRYLHSHPDLHPNVYTYNALLGVLKSNHCYDLAIETLEEMRCHGVASDIVTCNTVISMYDQQGRPEEALKVYEDLRCAGMVPDLFTFRTLIQVLARSGSCERVLELYRDLQHQELDMKMKREREQRQELAAFVTQLCYRRVWAWLGSDASTVRELGDLFALMQDTVRFTEKMCRDLIRACGQREIDHFPVKFLYFHMRAQGFYLSVSLCNHIIRVLGRGKRWWAALEVYENMMSVGPPPDETTHRLLLSHFQVLLGSASKRGIWKWALQLLEKMQEKGIEPDSFAWNAALIACARAHEPGSAIEVFQKMTACGQKPGVLSYGALLSALEKGNLSEKAEQVWEHMLKVGMKPNEYAYTTMITVRGKAGNYTKAVDLFHEMQRDGMAPTVVTYNAMITACARASDGLGAVKWLQQMEANCVQPDTITYSQVIGALSSANEWQLATSYYIRMRELELQIPCFVYDAVLKVCEANDAPVVHELIGPRPLDIKVHRGPDRRKPGGAPVIDVNIDAVVSTAF